VSPQPDHAPVVADPDAVAVPDRRQQDEAQPVDMRRQLHGGADDGTTRRVRPEVRVIMRAFVTDRDEAASGAERMAASRARALAAIPQETFEEELAKPKPSREKML